MTKRRRGPVFFLLPLAAGGIIAAGWLALAGGGMVVERLRLATPLTVVSLLPFTAGWLFVRFLRWQFLLRRAGVRLPIRPSLASYLAALPGTLTPAYVGEIARGLFIRRRFAVPLRATIALLVLERLYDVVALGLVLVLTARNWPAARLGAGFILLAILVSVTVGPIGRQAGLDRSLLARLRSAATVAPALALSGVAWISASLLTSVAATALGVGLPLIDGARVFAASTLLGAITLLPAGVGVTGSAAIIQLERSGVALTDAVAVVSLVRLGSAGVVITLGVVFLWWELRRGSGQATQTSAEHFDEIAGEYDVQWSSHMWDHLLARKLGLISAALPSPAAAGVGIDLGCGLGLQVVEMNARGYRVYGLDRSGALLAKGPSRGRVLNGDMLSLPFRDASLDFIYSIGALHHLPGFAAQQAAYREVSRVLKPGGIFLVHESNPRNPIFRFYMGYLFPILKSIDEGTESWVDPQQPAAPWSLRLERTSYFTFLPDFTPRALMNASRAVEERLEKSRMGRYSAHYMATLRKEPDADDVGLRPAVARADLVNVEAGQ